ncbi:hypothetical protein B0H11DRAFT_1933176 [Mycena galericulata]|nr:hypothetical protein B0H11DRAFT_1933176 [Mycena galericulata]
MARNARRTPLSIGSIAGDAGASAMKLTQPDGDVEAGQIETEEGGDGGGGRAARGLDAAAALVRGRRGHRGSGPRRGGSKGLVREYLVNMCEELESGGAPTMRTEATTTESLENMFVCLGKSLNYEGSLPDIPALVEQIQDILRARHESTGCGVVEPFNRNDEAQKRVEFGCGVIETLDVMHAVE